MKACPLLAYRWRNRSLESPVWSRWLGGAPMETMPDFRTSWFSEETLALHAAERGLGPLLCSDVLVDDALREGRLVRLTGPALPGFAFRIVEGVAPQKRGTVLFRDWLRQEAAAFRRSHEAQSSLSQAA
jgi:LysR family glycine cleavage system transcriptional activator